jgi:hypothetical protein
MTARRPGERRRRLRATGCFPTHGDTLRGAVYRRLNSTATPPARGSRRCGLLSRHRRSGCLASRRPGPCSTDLAVLAFKLTGCQRAARLMPPQRLTVANSTVARALRRGELQVLRVTMAPGWVPVASAPSWKFGYHMMTFGELQLGDLPDIHGGSTASGITKSVSEGVCHRQWGPPRDGELESWPPGCSSWRGESMRTRSLS